MSCLYRMTDAQVVIKGEIHTSESDLAEERELLVQGVDTLILEGQAEEAQFRLHQGWWAFVLIIFFDLFAKHIYISHTILEDLADAQGARTIYTRNSDLDILENSHVLVVLLAAVTFYVLLIYSILVGLGGNILHGSLWLLASALLPAVLLR